MQGPGRRVEVGFRAQVVDVLELLLRSQILHCIRFMLFLNPKTFFAKTTKPCSLAWVAQDVVGWPLGGMALQALFGFEYTTEFPPTPVEPNCCCKNTFTPCTDFHKGDREDTKKGKRRDSCRRVWRILAKSTGVFCVSIYHSILRLPPANPRPQILNTCMWHYPEPHNLDKARGGF